MVGGHLKKLTKKGKHFNKHGHPLSIVTYVKNGLNTVRLFVLLVSLDLRNNFPYNYHALDIARPWEADQ